MIPGRSALLGWRRYPRPSRTALLGITKTPTLLVSSVLLDLQAAPPLSGPSLGVPERKVKSRLRPALTLEEEEEERGLIKDLKRHGQLTVAWDRHGSPVLRWTLTRYGLDKTLLSP